MRITVASTFATFPPVGGAALRNFHLYRHLARRHPTELVVLAKPGDRELDDVIAPGLRERRIPASREHALAEAELSQLVGWTPVSDLAVSRLYPLTPAYAHALRESCLRADVVVASHPYLAALLRRLTSAPLVYEAPDVEVDLKRAVLPDTPAGRALLERVEREELLCCAEADLVLACTEADRARLAALYGVPESKLRVAPNGTDVEGIPFVPWPERVRARLQRADARPCCLFLASWHGPNLEAAVHVAALAEALPEVRFVIAGSVVIPLQERPWPPNVSLVKDFGEAEKHRLLAEADVALNPLQSGAGSNVKLGEYGAAGLPVVTTPFGARGYEDGLAHLSVRPLDDFAGAIREALEDRNQRQVAEQVLGARRWLEAHRSWRDIGASVAGWIEGLALTSARSPRAPLVSVLVPMFDAAPFVRECLESALAQTHSHLEVVVVDDGSRDGSRQIAESVARADPRVRVLEHPRRENRGVSRSRELALRASRGRYVALLDADDAFEPRKLEAQLQAMERHPGAVLCHTAVSVLSAGDPSLAAGVERHFATGPAPGEYRLTEREDALSSCRVLTSAALIDARAMRAVHFAGRQLYQSEDWLLFTLLGLRGTFVFLDERLARFRVYPASYTSRVLADPLRNMHSQVEFLLTLRSRVDGAGPLRERIDRQLADIANAIEQVHQEDAPVRPPLPPPSIPRRAWRMARAALRVVRRGRGPAPR